MDLFISIRTVIYKNAVIYRNDGCCLQRERAS